MPPPRYNKTSVKNITITDLLGLFKLDDVKLLEVLNDRSFGFELYLEGRTYGHEEIEHILHALAKVCEMKGFSNVEPRRKRLLRTVKLYEPFLFNDVPKVILDCLLKKSEVNLVSYVAHYMIILRSFLRYFSSSKVIEVFSVLQNYINRMRELKLSNLHIALNQFECLKKAVDQYEDASDKEDTEDVDKPQNFRTMSVVPRADDVVNYEKTKVPYNIVDCNYRSVGHYLSVHFRLMREDMLRSFRNCIKVCLEKQQRSDIDIRKSGGRIYDNVIIRLPPKYTVDGVCYNIKVTSSSQVDWVKTKSLMPGSLICLTPDDFKTVVFMTIKVQKTLRSVCSETNLVACIEVEEGVQRETLTEDLTYMILETNAYFESYRHLLATIKKLSEANFPLCDIITYLDYESPFPEYLVNESSYYSLHEHKDCQDASRDENEKHPCKNFNVLDPNQWPTMEELNLDDQQLEAFQTALTNKVAVIQGPPGTGKTFIGVKIVKALLENVDHKPILISCMTNHALDQFLALILKHTKKVVRLGGQSSNKALEPHIMRNILDAITDFRVNGEECLKTMNSVQRKTLSIAKALVREILECPPRLYFAEGDQQLRSLCHDLNDKLKIFEFCKSKYADDTALNAIIDAEYKNKLLKGSSSSSDALSTSVFEWLGVSRADDFYEKCKQNWQTKEKKNMQTNEKQKSSIKLKENDLWKIVSFKERFALFYEWRATCLQILQKHIRHFIKDYEQQISRYQTPQSSDKIELLKGADVVGITTTGASKYWEMIKLARPSIVIIEEAAEVLESHIIATLVPSVQHLILIGDHMQLKPLPFDNELATKHKLNISMFQRLFENGAPKATLASQHRMKPCIAELLALNIYPSLRSDASVYDYEEIRGVRHSMFFLEHSESEDVNSTGTSSSNTFEAEFVASLAKFFVMQGYSQSQITILATYAAQVPLIHKNLDLETADVYVTTVDNYQGEENDIILVSFVRSNLSGIGFLRESNRICVALSRAKKGMFCIGNFQLFKSRSPDWAAIVNHLNSTEMIGAQLPLQCPKHSCTHYVKCRDDVLEFLSQGCKQSCDYTLLCGHLCERSCHFNDADHVLYQCTKPCEKYMDETKMCPRLCFQPCKKKKKTARMLDCGHCSVLRKNDSVFSASLCLEEVQKLLPCNHIDTLFCHVDASLHKCRALVSVILDCGHAKKVWCHKKNELKDEKCHDMQTHFSTLCGHFVDVPCMLDPREEDLHAFCDKSCNQQLNCGHPCVGSCLWCMDMGIHPKCTVKCQEKLNCGHACDGFCSSPCLPCNKRCSVKCPHGGTCINLCVRSCVECNKPCLRKCNHVACTKKCFEICDVKPCNVACSKILPCSHTCIGLCGETCPDLCRECNVEDLHSENPDTDRYIMLADCGHVIEVKKMDDYVETRLKSFDWPHCPLDICKKLVCQSLRYNNEIKAAKEFSLASLETGDTVDTVYYLLHNMYGLDNNPPERFQDINKKMIKVMEHDKPSTAALEVFKTCVMCLGKLVEIHNKTGEDMEENNFRRFDGLVLWICNHLKGASYQQLVEIEDAVDKLVSDLKKQINNNKNNS